MDSETVETTDSKKTSDATSLIKEAIDRFKVCQDREDENWKRAKDAIAFRALDQWPDQVKKDRENPNQEGGPQPCPVLDKTNQYVRQVVNEERMNRPAIKVRPVDDEADIKVAEIYNGIIRHIEDASNADMVYTTGGEHAIDGGFGYWRILTEYCDPLSFDQEIRIKRIPNRFMVLLGPHTESDGSDAKYGFVFEDMDQDEFKRSYPSKVPSNFDALMKDNPDWYGEETIRVCEYMRIESRQATLVMLDDGSVVEKQDYEKFANAENALTQPLPGIVKERSTVIPKVRWYKLTATDILEERDLIGSFIPIVKVIGNELVMPDGKIRTSGMLETMMDPQRLHNYSHAGFITHIALAPRAPWVAAVGQIEDFVNDWKNANRKNIAVLRYKPVQDEAGAVLAPPQRTPPAGISPGWQQMLMNTEHGIEASVGMYGPSVGGPARERSGVALEGQKQQGSVGNYHYPDNLARSIRHTGRILIEMIRKIYDTQRVARIIGEDGTPDMAYLNPEQDKAVMDRTDEVGNVVGDSYNLNVGTYDVTVTVGPSWSTKRQEGAEMMTEATKANPELMQLIGDLYFRSLDVPYADKIAERLKAMLPPPIQEMEANKDKKPLDPKVQAMMAQIQQQAQELQMKGQALAQAEQQLQQESQKVGADKSSVQSAQVKLDAERKIFMADAARIKAEMDLKANQIMEEIKSVQSNCEEASETEPNKVEEKNNSPAVNVIDSSVAQPLSEVGQAVMQTAQIMQEISQSLQQNSAALTQLVAQQNKPKRATLSDGRTLMIDTGPMQ